MSIESGHLGRLDVSTALIGTTPSYTEVAEAQDIEGPGMASATAFPLRRGDKVYTRGPIDHSISFSCADSDDPGYQIIAAAFVSGNPIGVRLLDKATAGDGWEIDMIVEECKVGYPIEGVRTAQISLRPAPTATAPRQVTGVTP